jgi:ADP-ribosylglycohydrolase
LTHTDPKAEEGALMVARAASLMTRGDDTTPIEFLRREAATVQGEELRERLVRACKSLDDGLSPIDFANALGWSRGVSGYVNETVPAALYCWAATPKDFRRSVTSAVLLGDDTDSVAAIAGAVAGANLGDSAIPQDWIRNLNEWPRTVSWMQELAWALATNCSGNGAASPPAMHWLATLPRNAGFALIVLGIGLRRLLPPY